MQGPPPGCQGSTGHAGDRPRSTPTPGSSEQRTSKGVMSCENLRVLPEAADVHAWQGAGQAKPGEFCKSKNHEHMCSHTGTQVHTYTHAPSDMHSHVGTRIRKHIYPDTHTHSCIRARRHAQLTHVFINVPDEWCDTCAHTHSHPRHSHTWVGASHPLTCTSCGVSTWRC